MHVGRLAPASVLAVWTAIGATPAQAQTAEVVAGIVCDARTSAPLRGALVRIVEADRHTLSGPDGAFRIDVNGPGTYRLQVSLVGYALLQQEITLPPPSTSTLRLCLDEAPPAYHEEVTVAAGAFPVVETAVPSTQFVGPADLFRLRGVLADDALRAVQALPGVATGDDFSAEFSIRGSPPRSMGFVIDGVPAPLLLHTVQGRTSPGSVSLVNSDLLRDVTVLGGAYPQRTGGATGAQVAFQTRDGSRGRTTLRGMAGFAGASIVGEGPLGGDRRGSWLLAGRGSYAGWLIRRIDPSIRTSIDFGDVQVKLVRDLGRGHQIQALAIAGRLRLQEREPQQGVNSLNHSDNDSAFVQVGWRSSMGTSVVVAQRAYWLANRFANRSPRDEELGRGRSHTGGYRLDLTATAWPRVVIDAGGDAEGISADQVLRRFGRRPGTFTLVESYDASTWRASAYGQVRWTSPAARFVTTAGSRVDRWSLVNETRVSPWIQAEWAARPALSLTAAAGVHRQPPAFEHVRGLRGGPQAGSERARHADAGLEWHRDDWRARLTVFERAEPDGLWLPFSEPRLVAGRPVAGATTTRWINDLDTTARGVELMLQRRSTDGTSGWLAYSVGRTRSRVGTTAEQFDADFDQRHTLNAYATRRLSYRVNVSLRYRVGSNFPVAGYYAEGPAEEGLPTYVLADSRNATRLPYYARLDLRADRTFTWSSRRLTLFAEVVNALARLNVGLADAGVAEKLFPILPSAGVMVEF